MIEYRPEIDGLRAVAIVPVILFHLGAGWLPGGFLGVDVFFVISGFLITTILLREMTTGEFSFRRFWSRRVRRIAPALLVVTVATLVATWIFVFPPDRPAIGRQSLHLRVRRSEKSRSDLLPAAYASLGDGNRCRHGVTDARPALARRSAFG